jgi:hypothetical protein
VKTFSYHCLLAGILGCAHAWAGLQIPDAHQELGERYIGEQIEMIFDLENPDGNPVLITRVELGCSACLSYELTGTTVAPSGLEVLTVTFDSSAFSGPVKQTVSVFTVDRGKRPLTVSFRVALRPPFQVEPNTPTIALVPGEASQVDVIIRARKAITGKIDRVVPHNPELQVTLHPIEGEPDTVRCIISWDGSRVPAGPNTDFHIATDQAADLPGSFRLAHGFPSRLEIQPDIVYFNATRSIQKRLLIITQDPRKGLELMSVKVPSARFRYEVSPVRGTANYEVFLYGRGLDTLPEEEADDIEIEFTFRGKDQTFTARHPVSLL